MIDWWRDTSAATSLAAFFFSSGRKAFFDVQMWKKDCLMRVYLNIINVLSNKKKSRDAIWHKCWNKCPIATRFVLGTNKQTKKSHGIFLCVYAQARGCRRRKWWKADGNLIRIVFVVFKRSKWKYLNMLRARLHTKVLLANTRPFYIT